MRTVHDGSTSSSFYTFSQSVPIMDGMSGWKGAVRKIDLDAFFQLAEEVAPFHTLPPGFCLVGPQHLPGIPPCQKSCPLTYVASASVSFWLFLGLPRGPSWDPPAHASGRAKNRAPFHLATLALIQPPGVQQAGGRVHQGIARHGRLAKDRAPHLIRRDEPPTGALSSNTILRFEKASYTYHFYSPKMSRTRCVALL